MMSRTAAPSSEVTMPILRGRAGSGRLRAWSNRPSAASRCLQLIEGELQRAEAFRLEVLADDLIFALRVVDADAPARHDPQSVLWLEAQEAQRRTKHHALDLCRRVLEREVEVAGVPHATVRQLAFDPDLEKALLEQCAHVHGELGDGENSPLRLRRLAVLFFERFVGFLEGQIEEAHLSPGLGIPGFGIRDSGFGVRDSGLDSPARTREVSAARSCSE